MSYVKNIIPIKKCIVYRSGATYGTALDITSNYTLSKSDKLLIQFDFSKITNDIFNLSVARYAFEAVTSCNFGQVYKLTGDFTTSTSYSNISSIEGTNIINYNDMPYDAQKIFGLFSDDLKGLYGFEITGLTGTFKNSQLILEYEQMDFGLSIEGSNIDTDTFKVTFSAYYSSSYIINIYQNNQILCTKSGTKTYANSDAISITLSKSELNFKSLDNLNFEVVAIGRKYGSTVMTTAHAYIYNTNSTQVLTCNKPTISILEPNNINLNSDNNINVSWVSTYQDLFELKIDSITYTGTSQTGLIIPSYTISAGIKSMVLSVTRLVYGVSFTVSKTVTFTAYSKPSVPTLNLKTIYSTSTPTLNWASSGQVAYRAIIKKNNVTVIDTNEVISSNQFYNVSSVLENNTTYTVTLIIKNQYNLWSDEAIGTFSTQFTVLPSPSLVATSEDGGAIILKLNTNSENATEYKCSEIWRREPYGEWKRMAYDLGIDTVYRDFYIASDVGYEYKARNIATSGGVSESDIIIAQSKVRHYTLFDVEDTSKSITFRNDVVITPKYNQNIASNLFAGNEKPTTERGTEGYFDSTISFKTRDRSLIDKLINLISTSKVLLFKDCRGHKWFGNIVGNLDFPETNLGVITVTLQFLETNFLEQDVYSGNNSLYLLKFDGTWMFDGVKEFNGVG